MKNKKKLIAFALALVLSLGAAFFGLGDFEPALSGNSSSLGASSLVQSTVSTQASSAVSQAASSRTEAESSTAPPASSESVSSLPVSSAVNSSASVSSDAQSPLDEDGWYYSKEEVALYLYLYEHLPENFITKNEARKLGWEGGSVEKFAPGCAIGGDKFGNREGLLPKASGRVYYECDIDTNGANSRGAKRIVFSNDGLIYYTDDHYESFTLLEPEG